MPDVDVDRPWFAVRRIAPERRQQHLAGVDAPGIRRERAQQLELDIRELHRLAAKVDDAPRGIDSQLPRLENLTVDGVSARCGRSPQQRSNAAPELANRERLRDVVV